MGRISDRIEREAGLSGLVDRLAGLPGTDLRSLERLAAWLKA